MKKAAFLFLAIFLSASASWVSPASAGALSEVAVVDITAEEAAPRLCSIKIKGTYKGNDIDVTVTVEADNCAQAAADFLKRMAEK